MPHKPIHASDAFAGSSELGLYGDVIQELDDSVARIRAAIEEAGLTDSTVVMFSSDNGPWRRESSGGLRGRKGTTWDGGVRVPLLVAWPGTIEPRVCDVPVSVLDVKPTFDRLAGAGDPPFPMDGRDLAPLLFDGSDEPIHDALAFYRDRRLQAVRSGRFKLHVHRPEWKDRRAPLLFDLEADPGEQNDVASEHPDEVERLTAIAERFRADLGDAVQGVDGDGVRSAGTLR